jgi:hypothetical protein
VGVLGSKIFTVNGERPEMKAGIRSPGIKSREHYFGKWLSSTPSWFNPYIDKTAIIKTYLMGKDEMG